jgi:hypothetical protein
MYAEGSNPVMNSDALYHLIAESERWEDEVEPYSDDLGDGEKSWRLGFAAAMQRIEIAGRQVVEDCK